MKRVYESIFSPDGEKVRVHARGPEVLATPAINRGTAFTAEQRRALGIQGLLPSRVISLNSQLKRVYEQYCAQPDNLAKHVYLNAMRDRNEVLYFALLAEHLEEMLPIIYTPTIGEAIQKYSHWYGRPRGVYLSIDDPNAIEAGLLEAGVPGEDCDLLVTTDSEGILGIGDQGVGGVEIAVGKLAVYTAAAGIHPSRAIPVVLDVGTDNLALLSDEFYVGARHTRVRGERYDEFIARYVEVVQRLFPHAMLHWEDFGASNAHRVLETYRDRACTFNDDIQGTAAVVVAAAVAGVRAKGERMSDQRIVIHGAGTAGIGIADLLRDVMEREGTSAAEATGAFWCLGSRGLIHSGNAGRARDFQRPWARDEAELADWQVETAGAHTLADVVRNVQPTILVGTSGQPGSFTREIIETMSAGVRHPIVMPLSNPTSLAEATPADVLEWSKGQAALATGSPFEPVRYGGRVHEIAQANNALVFPGLGLGVAVCRASKVSDGMIAAAAEAVAGIATVRHPADALLPSIRQLRMVSATVAVAVVQAAIAEGLAQTEPDNIIQAVYDHMWTPAYPRLEVV
ncbi:MAG: NAD-dependent malic enzyme [Micrococcales bacterium]|nr:NAD-dependent malic enzyme [Micrococcales bacterium]